MSKSFTGLFSRISLQEKINFARQLAIATKSGLPLIESLNLIKKQTPSKYFGFVLEELIEDINNGQSLAQSLSHFPRIFDNFFVSIIRVGEESGNLSENLLYLSEELEKQREVNRRVKAAFIYPIIILVATLGIAIFLTFIIFPKILPLFVSLKVTLPLTTRIVISTLTFLSQFGLYVLGGIVLLVILIRFLLSVKKFHFLFDKFLLFLPFFSHIIISTTLANFTRSLGALLKSGMTLVDALMATKGTIHNLYYQTELDHVIEGVRKGEGIAQHLAKHPKSFAPMLVGMIQVGENTGNLEKNLFYLSEYYEGEVDNIVRNLTVVLEPLLLLIMGLLVGFIAVSIITPIYSVTQGLQLQ